MPSPTSARRALIALTALGVLCYSTPAASVARAASAHRETATAAGQQATNRPRTLSPAAATGALGIDLLRTLGGGNLVFSPDSIASALAMVGTGAAGGTEAQIQSLLHLSSPAALAGVGALQRRLRAEQAGTASGAPEAPTLDIANGLFLQDGFPVEAPFLAGLRGDFGAAPQRVDFVHESPEAVHTINAWVSAHTQGLIPALFSSLEPTTRLVLADAIYLKAAWLHPFSKDRTSPAPFYAPGQTSTVPFMNQTESIPYAQGSGWTAVELPYRASTLSLLVVLPTGSLAALEQRLDPALLERIAHDVRSTRVSLSIPRIHLTLHANLDDTLEALGVTNAFTDRADFSRIALAPPLKIGVVEHAADLKIDEAGTVAAAATGVEVGTFLISSPRPSPVRFNANRPFLFFLRDDRTGAVLFAGRLLNAAAAQS